MNKYCAKRKGAVLRIYPAAVAKTLFRVLPCGSTAWACHRYDETGYLCVLRAYAADGSAAEWSLHGLSGNTSCASESVHGHRVSASVTASSLSSGFPEFATGPDPGESTVHRGFAGLGFGRSRRAKRAGVRGRIGMKVVDKPSCPTKYRRHIAMLNRRVDRFAREHSCAPFGGAFPSPAGRLPGNGIFDEDVGSPDPGERSDCCCGRSGC